MAPAGSQQTSCSSSVHLKQMESNPLQWEKTNEYYSEKKRTQVESIWRIKILSRSVSQLERQKVFFMMLKSYNKIQVTRGLTDKPSVAYLVLFLVGWVNPLASEEKCGPHFWDNKNEVQRFAIFLELHFSFNTRRSSQYYRLFKLCFPRAGRLLLERRIPDLRSTTIAPIFLIHYYSSYHVIIHI